MRIGVCMGSIERRELWAGCGEFSAGCDNTRVAPDPNSNVPCKDRVSTDGSFTSARLQTGFDNLQTPRTASSVMWTCFRREIAHTALPDDRTPNSLRSSLHAAECCWLKSLRRYTNNEFVRTDTCFARERWLSKRVQSFWCTAKKSRVASRGHHRRRYCRRRRAPELRSSRSEQVSASGDLVRWWEPDARFGGQFVTANCRGERDWMSAGASGITHSAGLTARNPAPMAG